MRLGLPYARAEFDDDGRYHVVCPCCGAKCYPTNTSTSSPSVDDVTKGANASYARHFEEAGHTDA